MTRDEAATFRIDNIHEEFTSRIRRTNIPHTSRASLGTEVAQRFTDTLPVIMAQRNESTSLFPSSHKFAKWTTLIIKHKTTNSIDLHTQNLTKSNHAIIPRDLLFLIIVISAFAASTR